MRYFLAATLALILVACLAYFSFQLFNQPYGASNQEIKEQLISNKEISAENGTVRGVTNDDANIKVMTCQGIRHQINDLLFTEQPCKTHQDCQLIHSMCSYRSLNQDNHVSYRELRIQESENCSDTIIPVCNETPLPESFCLKNICQVVEKVDTDVMIKNTIKDIKKPVFK